MGAFDEREWGEVRRHHTETFCAFIDRARELDEDSWLQPVDEGRWSPAEITEHLRLTYTTLLGELDGGSGLRLRSGLLLRGFLRATFLRRILKTRQLPRGVQAPSELRPESVIEDRDEALRELRSACERFEQSLADRRHEGDALITHHLFGSFGAVKGIRFVTIHTDHHRKQLPNAAPLTDRSA